MKNKKRPLKNNMTRMHEEHVDLRQFQNKIETWKQLLESGTEENVLMKNSISDILRNNYDQSSLEEIEEFQTRFIQMDELIHSLKNKVKSSADLSYIQILEDKKAERIFCMKMKYLSKDITGFTARFHLLKSAFNDFQHKISEKREN
jgi:hypothetical protein